MMSCNISSSSKWLTPPIAYSYAADFHSSVTVRHYFDIGNINATTLYCFILLQHIFMFDHLHWLPLLLGFNSRFWHKFTCWATKHLCDLIRLLASVTSLRSLRSFDWHDLLVPRAVGPPLLKLGPLLSMACTVEPVSSFNAFLLINWWPKCLYSLS